MLFWTMHVIAFHATAPFNPNWTQRLYRWGAARNEKDDKEKGLRK
jgi:hypothetical protein